MKKIILLLLCLTFFSVNAQKITKKFLVGKWTSETTEMVFSIENKKDLVEVPKTILETMEVLPVKNVDEVLKVALTKPLKRVEWVDVDQISKKDKEKKELSTH